VALEHRQVAPVHAVQYALRVLEAVDNHRHGITAEQLAREIGVPPDYLGELLTMLKREGFISSLPDGGYAVGESLMLLGSASRDRALADRLRGILQELRDQVGAAVYFGRYDDGEIDIVDIADSIDTPRVNEWISFRESAHAMAMGKCLLAQLDHRGREDYFSRHRIPRLTSRTIVEKQVLLGYLESHPPTAPSLDLQEYAVGTVCAAVPLTVGKHAGCLALSLPVAQAHRLKPAADTLNERAAPMMLSLAI
jgi:DNA-binding IclR family transcriptional regulator